MADNFTYMYGGQQNQAQNPLALVQGIGALQHLMLQNQSMVMQQRAKAAIGPILQESIDPETGETDWNKVLVLAAQNPDVAWMAPELANQALLRQKTSVEIMNQKLDAAGKQLNSISEAAGALVTQQGKNVSIGDLTTTVHELMAAGVLPDRKAALGFLMEANQRYAKDPDGLYQYLQRIATQTKTGAENVMALRGQTQQVAAGGAIIGVRPDAFGNVSPSFTVPTTPTPAEMNQMVTTLEPGSKEPTIKPRALVPNAPMLGGQVPPIVTYPGGAPNILFPQFGGAGAPALPVQSSEPSAPPPPPPTAPAAAPPTVPLQPPTVPLQPAGLPIEPGYGQKEMLESEASAQRYLEGEAARYRHPEWEGSPEDKAEAKNITVARKELNVAEPSVFVQSLKGTLSDELAVPASFVPSEEGKFPAVGLKPGMEAYYTERGKYAAEYQQRLDDAAYAFVDAKKQISLLRELMQQHDAAKRAGTAETGGLADFRRKAAELAQGLGVDKETVDKIGNKSLAASQVIAKLLQQFALTTMRTLLGSQRYTNLEFQNFLENNPHLGTDPRAVETMLRLAEFGGELILKEQKYMSAWIREGRSPLEWPSIWTQELIKSKYLENGRKAGYAITRN